VNYAEHLSIDSNIRFGKVCITGTRITVGDVLGWLASGMSVEQIVSDFSELNDTQVRACLAYAADKEHILEIKQLTMLSRNMNKLKD
jgi:uncharacterized protein (DUF433 family)